MMIMSGFLFIFVAIISLFYSFLIPTRVVLEKGLHGVFEIT